MTKDKIDQLKFNASGCRDTTAYKAIKKIRRDERRKLISKLKDIANQYGYRIVSTIHLEELDIDEE